MTENKSKAETFWTAAEGFVEFCKDSGMLPAEAVACAATAIAIAMARSGNEWNTEAADALNTVVKGAVDFLKEEQPSLPERRRKRKRDLSGKGNPARGGGRH